MRTREREDFFWQMGKAGVPISVCRMVLRMAATCQRLAVKDCNEGLSGAEITKVARIRESLSTLLAEYSIKIGSVGGDPRGYVVKLHLPNGAYNTWGGKESGYGVPA